MSITPKDVAAELEANGRAAARFEELARRYGGERGLLERGESELWVVRSTDVNGWALCTRLPEALRRRVCTLIGLEASMLGGLDELDFWGAVWMGCQVTEGVVDAVLRAPASKVSSALLGAVGGPAQEVLREWLEGRAATLGALQVVQRALREVPPVSPFGKRGAEYFSSGAPEATLEQIRGLKAKAEAAAGGVSRVDYADLVKWMVGARTLTLWSRQGPKPNPPRREVALVHHYLTLFAGD